ncbi:Down syndrome cell adhesion molecule-like protein 1 [Hyalella azteca]|uniref:Down syndrome cell adhesion molecule-like protein 1 n=1 Tax=Hyalella azteca TaxID=294128 RepID=A0A979FY10_HYAAZ|nr:Down syndrome cell adhesion molecule-like protein 1 [Hyalella azteca]
MWYVAPPRSTMWYVAPPWSTMRCVVPPWSTMWYVVPPWRTMWYVVPPGAPPVQVTPGHAAVSAGGRVALTCRVDGHPVTAVAWYKDAVRLRYGHPVTAVAWYKDAVRLRSSPRVRLLTKEELVISPVHDDDAGLYQCRATSLQHVTAQATAFVTLAASAPRLVSSPRVRLLTKEELVISPVHDDDAGLYQCRATSLQHVTAQATAFVTLADSRHPVENRNLATLKGPAKLQKPKNALYVSKERPSSPRVRLLTKEELVISPVHDDDAGLYQCRATSLQHVTTQATAFVTLAGDPCCAVQVQRVGQDGTLEVSDVRRDQDQGSYSCTAYDRQGQSDSQETFLQVVVPPEVLPFDFSGVHGEGERVGASCILSKGDPPIKIRWTKDRVPLENLNLPNIILIESIEFSSMLMITSLTAEHSGRYACSASNGVTEARHEADLFVHVPPSWVSPPEDVSAALGGLAVVSCAAQGSPDPSLSWSRETASGEWAPVDLIKSSSVEEFVTQFEARVSHHNRLQTLGGLHLEEDEPDLDDKSSYSEDLGPMEGESLHTNGLGSSALGTVADLNGTLVFAHVMESHEGRYLCKANNGVGPGLSRAISLTVHEPPWFPDWSRRLVRVEVGLTGTYLLAGTNSPGPRVGPRWTKGGAPLVPAHRYSPPSRYQLSWTKCGAPLVPAHRGSPPNRYQLSWTKGGAPLVPTHRYHLALSEEEVEPRVLTLQIKDVVTSDSGTLECLAVNPHGAKTKRFTLLVEDVPGPPTEVLITEGGSRHVILSWTPPESDAGVPTSLTGYVIQAHEETDASVSDSQQTGSKIEVLVSGSSLSHRVSGLLPYTWYSFSVAAQNGVGRGTSSGPLRHRTQEEKPSAPPSNVQVVSSSSRSLRVTWMPPPRNASHGRLLGYYLGIRLRLPSTMDDASDEDSAYNFTTVGDTHTIVTDLHPHSFYDVIVRAFNSRGAGPSSDPVLGQTLQDTPSSPPASVSCSPSSAHSLTVSWRPPEERGRNGVIVAYHLAYSPSSSNYGTVGESSTHEMDDGIQRVISTSRGGRLLIVNDSHGTELSGLEAWTNYSITVAAATSIGVGVSANSVLCATMEGGEHAFGT